MLANIESSTTQQVNDTVLVKHQLIKPHKYWN